MLSQEDRNKLTPEELAIIYRDANQAAKTLGKALIRGERHPDPQGVRNVENPAHPGATVIRILRPRPRSVHVEDIDRVQQHNEFVSTLGVSGTRFEQ